ncbi:MAG: methyltransferase [Thermofilaceae archaeon]
MRKRELELLLSTIPPHPSPKLELEQYATPVHLASRLLWVAAFSFHDLPAQIVTDLGAGTGRLGIGAALMGSEYVLLVELDREALKVAIEAARRLGVDARVDAVCADVRFLTLSRRARCALQNPPFGVHGRGADVAFLAAALRLAERVYSVHKAETIRYVLEKCREKGAEAALLFEDVVRLPPTMPHHHKREHRVRVVVVRAAPFSS